MFAGPGGYRGEFMAWDPVQRKKVWAINENMPVWSGALVTAGDVAFYGTMDRWFKAVDAKDGKPLWQFHAGSGIIGQPVTYQGRDGRQYVAIMTGVGGWPGVVADAEVDPRVRNAALGFAGATQDLADLHARRRRTGRLRRSETRSCGPSAPSTILEPGRGDNARSSDRLLVLA